MILDSLIYNEMNDSIPADQNASPPSDDEEDSTTCLRIMVDPDVSSSISNGPSSEQLDLQWLESSLAQALTCLNVSEFTLNVIVVGDAYISNLHGNYLNDPSTTDVITFNLLNPPQPSRDRIDGEIYINHDEAIRAASDRKHSLSHELLLYSLHGILHLLGYDDHDPKDHRMMHALEDEVLTSIGIGRVFDTDVAFTVEGGKP